METKSLAWQYNLCHASTEEAMEWLVKETGVLVDTTFGNGRQTIHFAAEL